MKKVLFVATVVKSHIKVFHIPFLKLFKEKGWETSICARNDFDDGEDCVIPYCDNYYDMKFERSPIKKNNINVYRKLKKLVDAEKYNIVHCHTPVGGVLARLASAKARKNHGTKVIYTAHGFHFFKGAPLINWLLYFPFEWFCSFFTDVLITINKEDYCFAKNHMHAKKIEYVPGVGIDVEKYKNVKCDVGEKRKSLEINSDDIVILSVGEVNDNKNHETIIKAISKLKKDCNVTYVICGIGYKADYLKSLASELGVNLKLLGYRDDIIEIYKCCDIYAFPSKREGLSVALMEAMASGLPIVCSNIRGNVDLVENSRGGYLCDSLDVEDFSDKIERLILDDKLRISMGNENVNKIFDFSKDNVMNKMKVIYEV